MQVEHYLQAPSADYNVNALVLTPDGSRVIAGGAFANVSGVPAYGYHAVKAAVLLLAGVGVATVLGLVGDSWWQLLTAALLGGAAGPRRVPGPRRGAPADLRHRPGNERAALLVGTLVTGMSLAWWNSKHNRHHAAPNQIDRDPDIDPTVLHWYPAAVVHRSRPARFLRRHQGWWFFPLLTLEGVNLHVQAFRVVLGRAAGRRRAETVLLAARWGGYLTVLLLVLSPVRAAVFLGVQLAVVGCTWGVVSRPTTRACRCCRRRLGWISCVGRC